MDGLIAVSPPARQYASRFFPGEYRIIPNGIDMDHFSGHIRPIPGLEDGKLNILFVGRLEKRKGLRYLLEAYGRLKWDFPDTRLVVVGPGSLDKDCHRVLSERALDDVVFFNNVPYQDLPCYYRSADICLRPRHGAGELRHSASGSDGLGKAGGGLANRWLLVCAESWRAGGVRPPQGQRLSVGGSGSSDKEP